MTPAIIFYALQPAITRRFYEVLGLSFVEEKHGDGPTHYACDFHGMVFEIYPLREGVSIKPCESVGTALPVDDFEKTLAAVKSMDLKPGKVSVYAEAYGLRAVSVRDPDGRLVRLFERDPHGVQ